MGWSLACEDKPTETSRLYVLHTVLGHISTVVRVVIVGGNADCTGKGACYKMLATNFNGPITTQEQKIKLVFGS